MPKENWSKKNYRSEFLQSSFRFVIYLFKEVYRNIMSEIYFVDKTRYEDLRESSFNMTRGGGDEDIETRSLKF